MIKNSERRIFPRYPCTGAADIPQNGNLWGWGKVSDISRGGCYIETDRTLPVGAKVQLRLAVAGILLDIDGKVASVTPLGMGLDFVALSPEQESKLARIIKEVAASDYSPDTGQAEGLQSGGMTVRISRNAAPDILARVIKRVNERGILTRQELVEIVKASQ